MRGLTFCLILLLANCGDDLGDPATNCVYNPAGGSSQRACSHTFTCDEGQYTVAILCTKVLKTGQNECSFKCRWNAKASSESSNTSGVTYSDDLPCKRSSSTIISTINDICSWETFPLPTDIPLR